MPFSAGQKKSRLHQDHFKAKIVNKNKTKQNNSNALKNAFRPYHMWLGEIEYMKLKSRGSTHVSCLTSPHIKEPVCKIRLSVARTFVQQNPTLIGHCPNLVGHFVFQ